MSRTGSRACLGRSCVTPRLTEPIRSLTLLLSATIRCFRMQGMHYSWEWCEQEKNPRNCSVQLIEGHAGGYADRLVFDGFEVAKASLQIRREEGYVGK